MTKSISHRLFSKRTSSNSSGESGFTLIEILVAISLLAIVLASVYGVFTSVGIARDRLDKDSAEYHRARVLFNRIGGELRGAYFHPSNRELIFRGGLANDDVLELELTTTAVSPLIQAGSGIARVRYRLTKDQDNFGDGLVLLRSEHALQESVRDADDAGMMRLIPGVEAMTIRFFNNGAWQTRWEGLNSGLPELVEIALQLKTANQESVHFISAFDIPEANSR